MRLRSRNSTITPLLYVKAEILQTIQYYPFFLTYSKATPICYILLSNYSSSKRRVDSPPIAFEKQSCNKTSWELEFRLPCVVHLLRRRCLYPYGSSLCSFFHQKTPQIQKFPYKILILLRQFSTQFRSCPIHYSWDAQLKQCFYFFGAMRNSWEGIS